MNISIKNTNIFIDVEFPIGTEIWIMYNNKPLLGLVSEYKITVTSYTDIGQSWYRQLWNRWLNNNKQKDVYKYYFDYYVKLDTNIMNHRLEKKQDGWYCYDQKVYLTEKELKDSL